MSDNYTPVVADYVNRNLEYRERPPLAPPVTPTSDQNEEINLIATPLVDNVNSWTLMFVTGQADIDSQWDEYVASCSDADSLTELYAEIYNAG